MIDAFRRRVLRALVSAVTRHTPCVEGAADHRTTSKNPNVHSVDTPQLSCVPVSIHTLVNSSVVFLVIGYYIVVIESVTYTRGVNL